MSQLLLSPRKKQKKGVTQIFQGWILEDKNILTTFVQSAVPSQLEELGKLLSSLSRRSSGRFEIPELLRVLLLSELLSSGSEGKQHWLRNESPASNFMSVVSQPLMNSVLKKTLGKLITAVLSEKPTVEVDPARIDLQDGPELELTLLQNRETLLEWTQRFVDSLTCVESISKIPPEIKQIASEICCCVKFVMITDNYSASEVAETAYRLVGGWVLIRLVIPFLTTSFNAGDSTQLRRTFVLISKLISALNTAVDFAEPFMKPLQHFLVLNRPVMRRFLAEIVVQGEQRDVIADPLPYLDLFHSRGQCARLLCSCNAYSLPEFPSETGDSIDPQLLVNCSICGHPRSSHFLISSQPPKDSISTDQLDYFETPFSNFSIPPTQQDLMHQLLSQNGEKMLRCVIENQMLGRISSFALRGAAMCEALEDIGCRKLRRILRTSIVSLDSNSDQNSLQQHTQHLKECFKRGPDSEDGTAVYYLFCGKIGRYFWMGKGLDFLIHRILDVLGVKDHLLCPSEPLPSFPFSIIVDLSWVSPFPDRKDLKAISTRLSLLPKLLPKKRWDQLNTLFLVHFEGDIVEISNQYPSFLKRKMRPIPNWRILVKHGLPPSKVILSPLSKNFVTHSNTVVKVNDRGKCQTRVIKLTPISLLNVDPKTSCIKNEKLVAELITIEAPQEHPEAKLKFSKHIRAQGEGTTRTDFGIFHCEKAEHHRHYIFNSIEERDSLVDELEWLRGAKRLGEGDYNFRVLFSEGSRDAPVSYVLVKLTIDSILYISENKIISEIPFSGVETVQVVPDSDNFIQVRYCNIENTHYLDCVMPANGGNLLFSHLLEGKRRFLDNKCTDDDPTPSWKAHYEHESGDRIQPLLVTRKASVTLQGDKKQRHTLSSHASTRRTQTMPTQPKGQISLSVSSPALSSQAKRPLVEKKRTPTVSASTSISPDNLGELGAASSLQDLVGEVKRLREENSRLQKKCEEQQTKFAEGRESFTRDLEELYNNDAPEAPQDLQDMLASNSVFFGVDPVLQTLKKRSMSVSEKEPEKS